MGYVRPNSIGHGTCLPVSIAGRNHPRKIKQGRFCGPVIRQIWHAVDDRTPPPIRLSQQADVKQALPLQHPALLAPGINSTIAYAACA
jgi:hypothetical protein